MRALAWNVFKFELESRIWLSALYEFAQDGELPLEVSTDTCVKFVIVHLAFGSMISRYKMTVCPPQHSPSQAREQ